MDGTAAVSVVGVKGCVPLLEEEDTAVVNVGDLIDYAASPASVVRLAAGVQARLHALEIAVEALYRFHRGVGRRRPIDAEAGIGAVQLTAAQGIRVTGNSANSLL